MSGAVLMQVSGDTAVEIKEACPMGVFDIEDLGGVCCLDQHAYVVHGVREAGCRF